jgi:hypothetical protein
VRVDGKRVEYYHNTTYVNDLDVPVPVAEEVRAIMEDAESRVKAKIDEFESACDCYICQKQREKQKEVSL